MCVMDNLKTAQHNAEPSRAPSVKNRFAWLLAPAAFGRRCRADLRGRQKFDGLVPFPSRQAYASICNDSRAEARRIAARGVAEEAQKAEKNQA